MLAELGVDPPAMDNVVAIIDTQTIANHQGIHGRGDKIGLAALTTHYNLSFRDSHTAGDDAAYTMICAIFMAMDGKLSASSDRSLQQVVNQLEPYSKSVSSDVGISMYCTRCSSHNHSRPSCFCKIQSCKPCSKAGRKGAAHTHITSLCTR